MEPPKIFVSYRREDSAGWVGRLVDGLAERFGAGSVFQDIHSIRPGVDFLDTINEMLRRADCALVVIGPAWLGAWAEARGGGGGRRLDDQGDYVRLELATALRRGMPVIPVLVGGGRMPTPEQLPEDVRALARRNAAELSDKRWSYDLDQLARVIAGSGQRDAQASGSGTSAGDAAPSVVRTRIDTFEEPLVREAARFPGWRWFASLSIGRWSATISVGVTSAVLLLAAVGGFETSPPAVERGAAPPPPELETPRPIELPRLGDKAYRVRSSDDMLTLTGKRSLRKHATDCDTVRISHFPMALGVEAPHSLIEPEKLCRFSSNEHIKIFFKQSVRAFDVTYRQGLYPMLIRFRIRGDEKEYEQQANQYTPNLNYLGILADADIDYVAFSTQNIGWAQLINFNFYATRLFTPSLPQ